MGDRNTDWEKNYKLLRKKYACLYVRHKALQKTIDFERNVLTAWGLPRRLREYKESATKLNPYPEPEAENLIAAFSNRLLIGSFLGILISVGTLSIIFYQTSILSQQTQAIHKQSSIIEATRISQLLENQRNERMVFSKVLEGLSCVKHDRQNQSSNILNLVFLDAPEYVNKIKQRINKYATTVDVDAFLRQHSDSIARSAFNEILQNHKCDFNSGNLKPTDYIEALGGFFFHTYVIFDLETSFRKIHTTERNHSAIESL